MKRLQTTFAHQRRSAQEERNIGWQLQGTGGVSRDCCDDERASLRHRRFVVADRAECA